jgi:hypothetical protein
LILLDSELAPFPVRTVLYGISQVRRTTAPPGTGNAAT